MKCEGKHGITLTIIKFILYAISISIQPPERKLGSTHRHSHTHTFDNVLSRNSQRFSISDVNDTFKLRQTSHSRLSKVERRNARHRYSLNPLSYVFNMLML